MRLVLDCMNFPEVSEVADIHLLSCSTRKKYTGRIGIISGSTSKKRHSFFFFLIFFSIISIEMND